MGGSPSSTARSGGETKDGFEEQLDAAQRQAQAAFRAAQEDVKSVLDETANEARTCALSRLQSVSSHVADDSVRVVRETISPYAPILKEYGRHTSFGVYGLSIYGTMFKDFSGLTETVLSCRTPDEDVSCKALVRREFDRSVWRMAQPVLEPFLEGASEPLRQTIPWLAGAFFAYGACCLGFGYWLGRRHDCEQER
eukprot:TRINITY_DN76692_c0_g1_i1.p1 TRINITY_DN76692_c0_g1~~TRINITY_DN76692_c0_g1_i1.p1  ORF type:complete len:196 (+),score=16.82 TRINITY_DN76692_c0_g1_i1:42-629(+)